MGKMENRENRRKKFEFEVSHLMENIQATFLINKKSNVLSLSFMETKRTIMTNAFTRRILKEVDFVSKTTKKEKKKQTERERERTLNFLL
jgi:hypothetical protein